MSHGEAPARTRSLGSVLVAAGTSGVAGYVVLLLAARVLDPATNASFLVFWGALFAVFGALVGLTTETTRAVFASAGRGSTPVFPVLIGLGGSVAGVVGLTGLLWGPLLFDDSWPWLLGAMVVGIVLYVVGSGINGAAAGSAEWNAYSLFVSAEAVARMVLCAAVAAVGAHVVGLAWAVALASGTWLALVVAIPRHRRLMSVRAEGDWTGLARRMLVACSAAGTSALLLVGYPILLRVTTPADVYAGAAPIVLSVSLSRAPLMVPLGVYQNVLVTRVISQGIGAARGVLAGLLVVTLAGSGAAWVAGPGLLHLVNPAYDVSGPVFAALVVAAGLIAALTITGAVTVALDHHHVYLAGWIVATLVALVVLLVPAGLETRVVASLVAGPLVGIAVHMGWGLRRTG